MSYRGGGARRGDGRARARPLQEEERSHRAGPSVSGAYSKAEPSVKQARRLAAVSCLHTLVGLVVGRTVGRVGVTVGAKDGACADTW